MISLSGDDQRRVDTAAWGGSQAEVSNLLHEMPPVATPDVERLGIMGALQAGG